MPEPEKLNPVNVTLTFKPKKPEEGGDVQVFPNQIQVSTSGDYLVLQAQGHMRFFLLSEIDCVDWAAHEA